MAFLTSAVADLFHDPSGLWEILILKVFKFIGNYGWRIVLFTVCLKLLLLPLDIYQRFKMRKNQLITERIKPQLEKLQQQYANDTQTLQQKQMQLQRSEGFSYFSSCLPAIVTLVVFFYLFSGLNNISRYMNLKQYVELYDAYTAVETVEKDAPYTFEVEGTEETKSYNEVVAEIAALDASKPKEEAYTTDGVLDTEAFAAAQTAWGEQHNVRYTALTAANLERYNGSEEKGTQGIKQKAQAAVEERYGDVQESFLWVSNIWSPDVPWRKAILSYKDFKSNIGDYAKYGKAKSKLKLRKTVVNADGEAVEIKLEQPDFEDMISETRYNTVTEQLRRSKKYNPVNGYMILPILSMALSFLSQFIMSKLQKNSGQTAPQGGMGGSMKFMMFFMPVMMGIFSLMYTAMFTIYIVINSGVTILSNIVMTLAFNGKSKHTEKKKTTTVQKYGRPDPKDL